MVVFDEELADNIFKRREKRKDGMKFSSGFLKNCYKKLGRFERTNAPESLSLSLSLCYHLTKQRAELES